MVNMLSTDEKKLIEKLRECHNHKPLPTPDTKWKKRNKQMQEKHID